MEPIKPLFYRCVSYLWIPVLAVLLVPTKALAQANDSCGCNAALVQGVYSYRAERGDTSATSQVERFLAQTSWDELQRQMAAGGGIMINGFGLNANTSRAQYEAHRATLQKKYSDYMRRTDSRELLERYGDQHVLQAWKTCKSTCNTSGVLTWVEVHDDRNLVLVIQWTPPQGSTTNPSLSRDSSITGARVDSVAPGKLTTTDKPLPVGQTRFRLLREDVEQPILIHIRVPGMDRSEYVPRAIPVLPLAVHAGPPQPPAAAQALVVERLRITTLTGSGKKAATDAKVFLLLAGSEVELSHPGNDRQRNQTDVYVVKPTSQTLLSDLQRHPIVLRHDGTDRKKKNTTPDWECASLEIEYFLAGDSRAHPYARFERISLPNRAHSTKLQ